LNGTRIAALELQKESGNKETVRGYLRARNIVESLALAYHDRGGCTPEKLQVLLPGLVGGEFGTKPLRTAYEYVTGSGSMSATPLATRVTASSGFRLNFGA
jgi:hypothetical protein